MYDVLLLNKKNVHIFSNVSETFDKYTITVTILCQNKWFTTLTIHNRYSFGTKSSYLKWLRNESVIDGLELASQSRVLLGKGAL